MNNEYKPLLRAIDSTTFTISTSPVSLPSVPANTKAAQLTIELANIRYWKSGLNPTSTTGHKFEYDTGELWLYGTDVVNSRFIRGSTATVDAKGMVTYYA